jgi:putative ABC transport system substrate-binding protein
LPRVRAALAQAGFVDGATLATEVLAPALDGSDAAAIVGTALRNGAELIVAQGPVVPPLHRAVAQRVPMVVAFSGDLVAAGLADSLRIPGRRTTGVSFLVLELVGKRLELLTEVAPKARRVGVLLNSRHYGYQAELAETERAAHALKLATETFDARSPQDFVRAFEAMARAKLDGVVVFPDATMTRMAPDIAAFGLREKLPVISGWAAITEAGALASYGPDLGEAYDRVGAQAARILRGADASAMPIELPTRIRTTLNLKTAQALGVALPPSLTARAEIV